MSSIDIVGVYIHFVFIGIAIMGTIIAWRVNRVAFVIMGMILTLFIVALIPHAPNIFRLLSGNV